MGVVVTRAGKLRQPSAHSHAANTCRLCDDWPKRCGETFVCSICGRRLQTCTWRAGGFPPGGEDTCVTCWERREVLAGHLPPNWEITGGAAIGEKRLRQARQRAKQLSVLIQEVDVKANNQKGARR